jgi:uncharacterized Zn-finger protein
MSNTISEGEIVIKDELPEVEPIKALQVPVKIEQIDDTKEVVISVKDNKLERFEISTLAEEEVPEDQEIFVCDCKLTFKTEWQLKRHLEGHNVKEYTCQICGKNFKDSTTLKQHSYVHSETRNFPCDQCEKRFKTSSNLLHHKPVHNKETPFKCSICGKGFKLKSYMKSHELIHTQPIAKRRRKRPENSNNS